MIPNVKWRLLSSSDPQFRIEPVALKQLLDEREFCYHEARRINAKRLILCRALRVPISRSGFHEVLSADLAELTEQLQEVLAHSRRLTLEISFHAPDAQVR